MNDNTIKDQRYFINGEPATGEEYRSMKYENVKLRVPIGKKELIRKYAENGPDKKINSYINRLIREDMGAAYDGEEN